MQVLRHIDPDRFQFHFFVNTEKKGTFDDEILTRGGTIHYGGCPQKPLAYRSKFQRVVREHGPFDAVHSHVYWFSGYISKLASEIGVPVRIAHSHTTVSAPAWKWHRRAYQSAMRRMILKYATHRLGASRKAAEALFGAGRRNRSTVLYYGIDFRPFMRPLVREDLKRRLGIAPSSVVIGHVGRFVAVKNHAFILNVFAEILRTGLDSTLVLVGDGPLLAEVKERAVALGIERRCVLAGSQKDVVPYLGAMDAFMLPSLWEGFSIAAVESQAAGVPVVASTTVPEDMIALPRLVERIPLNAGAERWAETLVKFAASDSNRRGDEPELLQNSKFGLPTCLNALTEIYEGNQKVNY